MLNLLKESNAVLHNNLTTVSSIQTRLEVDEDPLKAKKNGGIL